MKKRKFIENCVACVAINPQSIENTGFLMATQFLACCRVAMRGPGGEEDPGVRAKLLLYARGFWGGVKRKHLTTGPENCIKYMT